MDYNTQYNQPRRNIQPRRYMVPKRKKSGIKKAVSAFLTFCIVLLFMVASFFAGYYTSGHYDIRELFEKKTKESKKSDTEEDGDEKRVNINNYKVSSLIPSLLKGIDCWAIEEFTTDRKVVANDISNQRAFAMAEANNFYFSGKQTISLEEVNTEIQKRLGKSYKFDPELLNYHSQLCPQYEYHKDTKEFVINTQDCRTVCGENTTYYEVVGAKEVNGKITIDVKVLFGTREGTDFYANYDKIKFITSNPKEVKTAIGQGGEYKFTFKEENGYYVFVSSEPA